MKVERKRGPTTLPHTRQRRRRADPAEGDSPRAAAGFECGAGNF